MKFYALDLLRESQSMEEELSTSSLLEKNFSFDGDLANHEVALHKVLDILVNPEYGVLHLS